MSRITLPAALTLAVMALPLGTLPPLADDAHHPAQGTPAGQTQSQVIPPVDQTPGPPALQSPGAQAPATGQAPAGSAPGQTRPPRTTGSMMMDCPMMQGSMQGQMMQMMQGMMQMMQMHMMQTQMQMMQGQVQSGGMPPATR
jgi:hypothetical protein